MATLSNPVLTRELRTGLRGHRAFFLRTAFVTVLAVVIITTWITAVAGMTGTWQGVVLDVRTIPGLGRQLFAALGTALLVLLLALIPGYAAGAISGERETRTLEMMLCTWLRPRSIVLGKLGASTVFAIGLMLSSLPAVSAVFLLGGVSPLEVGLLFLLLLSASIFVAALSLFVSSYCAKTYMAVMVTYLLIGCLHYAGPFAARVALRCAPGVLPNWRTVYVDRGDYAQPLSIADYVNPIFSSRSLFGSAGREQTGMRAYVPQTAAIQRGNDQPLRFAVFHSISPAAMLLGALVLLLATTRVVARSTDVVGPTLAQRFGRWITRRTRARPAEPHAAPAEREATAPARRLRRAPSPWRRLADRVANPVLARDLRGRPLGSGDIIARAGLYGFVATELVMLIATMAYAAGDSAAYFLYSDWAATAMAVLVVVAAFLAAIPAAMSIAVEKEQRTLEMVVATLLRPHTILWGKLAAAFWQAQPLVLLAVPLGVLCAAVDVVPWRSAAYMLLCAETFALATCAVGVFVSLLARRPARAVSVTACIVAGLAIGPILLLRLGISHLAGLADPGRSLWVGPLGVLQAVFAQPAQRWQLATDAVIGAFAIALLAFLAALALFRTTVRRAIESA